MPGMKCTVGHQHYKDWTITVMPHETQKVDIDIASQSLNQLWSKEVLRTATLWCIHNCPLCLLSMITLSQVAKTFGSPSIRNRSDAKVSDRCLIDVDPMASTIWNNDQSPHRQLTRKSADNKLTRYATLKTAMINSWHSNMVITVRYTRRYLLAVLICGSAF